MYLILSLVMRGKIHGNHCDYDYRKRYEHDSLPQGHGEILSGFHKTTSPLLCRQLLRRRELPLSGLLLAGLLRAQAVELDTLFAGGLLGTQLLELGSFRIAQRPLFVCHATSSRLIP